MSYSDYALIKKDTLTDIGNAIRTQKGTSDLIDPADFSSEIESIEGGTIIEGHAEVDSIISDGACYINTNICPNPNYSIEMKCRLHTIVDDRFEFLFGTRNGDYGRWQARFDTLDGSASNQLRVQRSISNTSTGSWYTSNQTKQDWMEEFKVLKLSKNEVYIDGILQHTFNSTETKEHYPYPVYFFSCNDAYSENAILSGYGHLECEYAKMWNENDELILDLVPVVKNDGTICMYNKVNGAYYYNVGTGTFTYPGEAEEPTVSMEEAMYEYYGIDKEEYPYLYIASWYNSSKNWRIKPIFCQSIDDETGVLTGVLGTQEATTKSLSDDDYNNTAYYDDVNTVFDYMKESNIVFNNSYESYQSDNLTDKCMYYTNWNATYYTNWADLRTLYI